MTVDGYNVQSKISCVFDTCVVDGTSAKRRHQNFRVLASENLSNEAEKSCITSSHASEKIDGTCCYVAEFEGIKLNLVFVKLFFFCMLYCLLYMLFVIVLGLQ